MLDPTFVLSQYHMMSMIITCMVVVIYYKNQNCPITVLLCMFITLYFVIDTEMFWFDHCCLDTITQLILHHIPLLIL